MTAVLLAGVPMAILAAGEAPRRPAWISSAALLAAIAAGGLIGVGAVALLEGAVVLMFVVLAAAWAVGRSGIFLYAAASIAAISVGAGAVAEAEMTALLVAGLALVTAYAIRPSVSVEALRAWGHRRANAVSLGAAGLLAASVGVGVAFDAVVTVAVVGAAAALATTIVRPKLGIALGLVAIAVPYAWSPTLSGTTAAPALAVGSIWALAGFVRAPPWRIKRWTEFGVRPLDVAVGLFIAAPLVSAVVQGGSFELFLYFAANAGLPYFGLRLLLASSHSLNRFAAIALLCVGTVVAAVAVVEAATGINVSEPFANVDLQQWSREYSRAGLPRVDSTLGHPIALGAFLLIAFGLCLTRSDRRWLLALPILLAAETLSFSRGPWAALVALVAILAVGSPWWKGRWLPLVVLLAVTASALLLAPPVRDLLFESFGGESVAGANAELRFHVIGRALDDMTVLGNPLPQSQTDLLIPGSVDVASFLALTVLRTGALGLLLWLVLGVLLVRSAWVGARLGVPDLKAMSAVMLVQFLVLTVVSMITNFQHFFWLSMALLTSLEVANRVGPRDGVSQCRDP